MKKNRKAIIVLGILAAHLPLIHFLKNDKSSDSRNEPSGETIHPNKGTNHAYHTNKKSVSLPSQPETTSDQGTQTQGGLIEGLRSQFPYPDPLHNQRYASGLRKFLKQNPGARDSIASTLLDPGTPLRTFANLSLILGSIGGEANDRILLQALDMYANEPDRAQWAIFAMGAWRENPGWDERFSFDSRGPMILQTDEGISTPVFHQITNRAVREALTPYLQHPDGVLRTASILTLRHSLGNYSVRKAFVEQLPNERNPGNESNIAEALARNVHKLIPEEQTTTIDALLEQAANTGTEGVRLKILHPLQSTELNPNQIQKLEKLSLDDPAPSIRRFALSLLSSQSQGQPEPHRILLRAAHNDPDPSIRAAVISLIQQHPTPVAPEALIPILDNDSAWNVRHSTLEALSELPPDPQSATAALNAVKNAALNDPHPKVSQFAMNILHGKTK